MAKSIVAKTSISAGTILSEDNLTYKSPSGGLPPYEIDNVIGKVTLVDLEEDDLINLENIKSI